ncbi:MAG: ketoacyl-ACP synthase III, partial [Negativicutes bacterium]|nr:ketoacyl-ACP synthase III [Negativicutes bacterium]
MTSRNVGILGMGMYVPEKVITNADLEKIVDTSDQWIVERTGIRQRRMLPDDWATSDMAVMAARQALDNAGVTVAEIDLIVVATATPDTFFPSVACLVQNKLNAPNMAAFDLVAGCSGFVYALVTASQFLISGSYQRALVIGADALTRVTNWQDRNTCILFGDGAGAVVLGEVPAGYGLLGFELGADGSGGELLKLPAGGSRLPASHDTVDQRLHYIYMNGNEVYKFAVKAMGEAAVRSVENAGLTSDDIRLFIPHQANMRIIQAAAKRLKMPMDRVMVNLDRYGNTSAASIPMALCEAVAEGKVCLLYTS